MGTKSSVVTKCPYEPSLSLIAFFGKQCFLRTLCTLAEITFVNEVAIFSFIFKQCHIFIKYVNVWPVFFSLKMFFYEQNLCLYLSDNANNLIQRIILVMLFYLWLYILPKIWDNPIAWKCIMLYLDSFLLSSSTNLRQSQNAQLHRQFQSRNHQNKNHNIQKLICELKTLEHDILNTGQVDVTAHKLDHYTRHLNRWIS